MRKLSLILAFCAAIGGMQAEKRTNDRLADSADAVVLGEVQSGWQTGYSVSFVLSVTRTLKGELQPGAAANVTWQSAMRTEAPKDLRGHYGLWFLRRTGASQWRLQRVHEGRVPFEAAYFSLPRGSTPASVPTASRPLTIYDLMALELAGGLQQTTDRSQRRGLAAALWDIGESAVMPDLYRALRSSGNNELRILGLGGLLRANYMSTDLSVLAEIASNVELIPSLEMRGAVLSAIEGRRDADPNVIRYMGIMRRPPMSISHGVLRARWSSFTRATRCQSSRDCCIAPTRGLVNPLWRV